MKQYDVKASDENDEKIAEICGKFGMSMVAYIVQALRLYHYVKEAQLEGKKLYLGKDNEAETEILV